MLECLRCLIPSPSSRLCSKPMSMGFGAHGKKRQRLGDGVGDGGPSELKRAFSGQGLGDDARGSVTSTERASEFFDPHFPGELACSRNSSTCDSSSISTIAEYHNADASSRCSSRYGDRIRADAWEEPLVDIECIKSEETRNWASSFSDLRSELTVSGHDAFASRLDSHHIRGLKPSVGLASSAVRPFKIRGNRPPEYGQVLTSRKDRERRASHSERSCGCDLTQHFKEGASLSNHAVDTSSELQEFHEAAEEKQPRSAFSLIPLASMPQESSVGLCMDEQPRASVSVGEDRLIDIDSKTEHVEGRVNESLSDCPTRGSIEEDAFSGESNDKSQRPSYVHSSGRLSLEERSRLGERSRTIDHDFEDFFSALLL